MTNIIKVTNNIRDILVCPYSHEPLREIRLKSFQGCDFNNLRPIKRVGFNAPQIINTESFLITQDGKYAYPIIDGFPVLLWPDVHTKADHQIDLNDSRYSEVYSEMEHYNLVAMKFADNLEETGAYKSFRVLLTAGIHGDRFPYPEELWIDQGSFDIQARLSGYRYIAPVTGKVVMNLGGHGRDAIRFLLAGASQAILVTPMLGEAVLSWRLAEAFGASDRFTCLLGIGEELPLQDESIDVISSQGCLHHMRLEYVFSELRRVLKPGGRFVATDPWEAPLYRIGTRIFGKREQRIFDRKQHIFCQPMTQERLSCLSKYFPSHVISNHGPVLRYALLALNQLGLHFSQKHMCTLSRIDDKIGKCIGLSSNWGSSLMLGGERT